MNTKLYIGCAVMSLVLLGKPAMAQEPEQDDNLINVAFGKVAEEDIIYAVSSVNIADLSKKTASSSPLSTLSSYISGYNGNVWDKKHLCSSTEYHAMPAW